MNFQYPDKLTLFGHEIDVVVLSEPINLGNNTLGVASFVPETGVMSIWHNPNKPSIGHTSLFHEMVEAVDAYADLQMNHTQITTLASAFCQMWKDLPEYRHEQYHSSLGKAA